MVFEEGKFRRMRSSLPTMPDMRLLHDPMTSSSTRWLSSSIATDDAGHRLAIDEAMASGENILALWVGSDTDGFCAGPPPARGGARVADFGLTGAGAAAGAASCACGTATWEISVGLIVILHNGHWSLRELLAMPRMQSEQKMWPQGKMPIRIGVTSRQITHSVVISVGSLLSKPGASV